MTCDCSGLSPYHRLALAFNEVMNVRADLDPISFDAATRILTDMDALISRVHNPDPGAPLPLYTSLCNHTEKPDG